MLEELPPLARRELEARLSADLADGQTAAERRIAELGALAEMLDPRQPEPGWAYSTIPHAE
jgi:hypothetical protein